MIFIKNVIKSIYKASSTHFLFFFTLIAGCVALLPTFLYVFFCKSNPNGKRIPEMGMCFQLAITCMLCDVVDLIVI